MKYLIVKRASTTLRNDLARNGVKYHLEATRSGFFNHNIAIEDSPKARFGLQLNSKKFVQVSHLPENYLICAD